MIGLHPNIRIFIDFIVTEGSISTGSIFHCGNSFSICIINMLVVYKVIKFVVLM